jgi:hypothetical protein
VRDGVIERVAVQLGLAMAPGGRDRDRACCGDRTLLGALVASRRAPAVPRAAAGAMPSGAATISDFPIKNPIVTIVTMVALVV